MKGILSRCKSLNIKLNSPADLCYNQCKLEVYYDQT